MNLIFDGNIFLNRAIFVWRKQKYLPLEHFFLNQLQKYIKQFSPDYIYIAADLGSSWRKEIYPDYKFKRKEARAKYKDIPWTQCFFKYQMLLKNLNRYTDIYTLQIPYIEGDDIISYLGRKLTSNCLVLTKDKDLLQLASLATVRVGLLKKKDVDIYDQMPDNLKEDKIYKGDVSDNISKAHNFVEAVRNDILTNLLFLPMVVEQKIEEELQKSIDNKEVNLSKFKEVYPYKVVDKFIKVITKED